MADTIIPLTPHPRPTTGTLINDTTGSSPVIEKPPSFPVLLWWRKKWRRNQGMLLILSSEMFGALMVTSARLLQNGVGQRLGESEGKGRKGNMLTLQIIFVRFSLTLVFSSLYMWYTKVPDFPWGKPDIRWLLILRGFAGFFAVFGFYYSVKYLPIAEAVVLSFFTPLLTAYSCSLVLGTPFARRQVLGGILCLFGVVLIARPDTLLHLSDKGPKDPSKLGDPAEVQPIKRLLSIILGVSSCVGSAAVYTIIRVIGSRAHALISVNYYAIIASLSSFLLLLFLPGISFQLPSDLREWLLLFSLGIYGFLLQFLMTKGLQLEKGSRGTNMMYSQIVFALLLDWGIWGVWPTVWSWVGGAVVVGSTVWIAVQDGEKGKGGEGSEGEEEGLVDGGDDDEDIEEIGDLEEGYGDREDVVEEEGSK